MPTETVAAIDLGSNSFHMIVARIQDGQLQVVDKLKEMVQLAAGLDRRNRLSAEARERALNCLARFGQRLRHLPTARVRVVGTNTLRKARGSEGFLAEVQEVLGHPVEVISGIEEARLIYLGVAHTTANVDGRRLVIDIGGGSTELIIGEHFDTLHLESLYMGCVSMSTRCFANGRVRESAMAAAELKARLEMEPVEAWYRDLGWQLATGASGTIKAIRDVVAQEGWSRDAITLDALRKLRAALVEAGSVEDIARRWDLGAERAAVFPGGFAVLHGVCEVLDIERLEVSDGALREGLVYELLGRIRHEDVRDRTIAALSRRYAIDVVHAERVAATAKALLAQAQVGWGLEDEEAVQYLERAARLHEIGLAIAHGQYHKHGHYVVRYSDMPGFGQGEQEVLAALVRGHRRKFPKAELEALPKSVAPMARHLCVLLRLAVVLNRSRSRQAPPALVLSVGKRRLKLLFPPGWLADHPLTRADLDEEAEYLQTARFQMEVGELQD